MTCQPCAPHFTCIPETLGGLPAAAAAALYRKRGSERWGDVSTVPQPGVGVLGLRPTLSSVRSWAPGKAGLTLEGLRLALLPSAHWEVHPGGAATTLPPPGSAQSRGRAGAPTPAHRKRDGKTQESWPGRGGCSEARAGSLGLQRKQLKQDSIPLSV